jgi:hypothetical protein
MARIPEFGTCGSRLQNPALEVMGVVDLCEAMCVAGMAAGGGSLATHWFSALLPRVLIASILWTWREREVGAFFNVLMTRTFELRLTAPVAGGAGAAWWS